MNIKKQRRKNEETPVARTTEVSDKSISQENLSMLNIAEQPIKTQISELDRSDISPQNVKDARFLLQFTGRPSKHCALFLKNGKEMQTAWFKTRERAKQAFDILVGKGFQSMIYTD